MSERITNETLSARTHNLNRRLKDADRCVVYQARNGHIGLDEGRPSDGAIIRTLTVGTKREVAEFLHAMMVGIDMARA